MKTLSKNMFLVIGLASGVIFASQLLVFPLTAQGANFIRCSTNADCGAEGFTGSQYCRGNDVFQDYRAYTCINPGTSQSTCVTSQLSTLVYSCSPNQCQRGFCASGTSSTSSCFSNSDCGASSFVGGSYCQGNGVYRDFRTYTCNNPGSSNAYCSSSTTAQLQQICSVNQTCSSGSCAVNFFSPPTYQTYNLNAYLRCWGNSVYWHDSNNQRQFLYQACGSSQTCVNNACVNTAVSVFPYAAYTTKACFKGSVYWYDSLGNRQGLIQNCRLTGQTCQDGQCVGAITVVAPAAPAVPAPAPYSLTTSAVDVSQLKIGDLVVSFFVKREEGPLQWEKGVNVVNEEVINFLAVVKNNSSLPANGALLKADFANAIVYSGNLKINGFPRDGNVANGIILETVAPGESRAVLFDGAARSQFNGAFNTSVSANKDSIVSDTDQITINVVSTVAAAAVSGSGISGFFRRLYPWIIVIIIIIILFIILFRRFSSK